MKIIVDVMSGDNAPLEIIKGAVEAAEAFDAEIIIVGDENVISDVAVKNEIDLSKLKMVHANSVIDMEDKPMCVVREKKDSSMSIGLKMLANGEADAFVSAGNTGALITGATLIVRRMASKWRTSMSDFYVWLITKELQL